MLGHDFLNMRPYLGIARFGAAIIAILSFYLLVKDRLPNADDNMRHAWDYIQKAEDETSKDERNDQYRLALDELNIAIQNEPGRCSAHLNIGLIHWAREELESTEAPLLKAIKCDKNNPMAHYHYAVYLMEKYGHYTSDARDHFRTALSQNVAKRFEDKQKPFCNIIQGDPTLQRQREDNAFQVDLEVYKFLACQNKLKLKQISVTNIEDGMWWINARLSPMSPTDSQTPPVVKLLVTTVKNPDKPVVPQACISGTTEVQPDTHPNTVLSAELQSFIEGHFAASSSNEPLPAPFCIQNNEVSKKEYNLFLRDTQKISVDQDSDFPVENISRTDAQKYAQWLSQTTHHSWRLPTAKEWRFAALQYGEQHPVFNDASHPTLDKSPSPVRDSGKPEHLLGNLREWSSDDCPIHGMQLLGGNYLSGIQKDLCDHASDKGEPGVGFRLLYSLSSATDRAYFTGKPN